ncbi:hypothetical protein MarSH_307 [Marseillevirus Shanghai 1]|nr:hypothetical protein MarSH_307 [Marseillevirus Shanghai 1]
MVTQEGIVHLHRRIHKTLVSQLFISKRLQVALGVVLAVHRESAFVESRGNTAIRTLFISQKSVIVVGRRRIFPLLSEDGRDCAHDLGADQIRLRNSEPFLFGFFPRIFEEDENSETDEKEDIPVLIFQEIRDYGDDDDEACQRIELRVKAHRRLWNYREIAKKVAEVLGPKLFLGATTHYTKED